MNRWPESELEPGDVVFEVGAYEGAWIQDIPHHGVYIYAFEPDPDTFSRLEDTGLGDTVYLYNYGLGGRDAALPLGNHDTDGASFCKDKDTVAADMVDIDRFFTMAPAITDIKIMRINIEGGEYELLSRMIDTGHITKIQYLMVHWHDIPPGAMVLRLDIERALWHTHRPHLHKSNPTWDIWERHV